jgi:LmbE family N-acetylglucosaminyl deacetylase
VGADGRGGGDLIERWSPGDGVDRVLVVTAHPDDVDFGAAGTVGVLTASGVRVSYCVVTNGEAGGDDRGVTRDEMAAVRREEQRAAAAEVGVDDVTFLGHPDGRVLATLDLRRDITAVIRRVRPQRVLAPSPERMWDRIFASHPDHLAVGEAATCAVYPDARNPFAHPGLLEEGLEPHVVDELWLMADPSPTLAVDVTAAFERKIAALSRHRSQLRDVDSVRERLGEIARWTAREAGLDEGSLAETFRRVPTGRIG